MKVKFWGTRGSTPAPLTLSAIRDKVILALQGARGVDLSDPLAILAYVDGLSPLLAGTAGGNTSCVELQVGGQTIILDAGTGLRQLGMELMNGPCGRGQGVVHLFLSHTHWDHIQGLPFFDPAYVPGNRLYIYSVEDVTGVLADQMKRPVFPVPFAALKARIDFVRLTEGKTLALGGVRVSTCRLPHPDPCYAFRIEHLGNTVVYATDGEYKRLDPVHLQPYVEFFSDADVLIFDAQYSLRESLIKEHWGHSSAMVGLELAWRAGVKRLVLFHHDPNSSDADLADLLDNMAAYRALHEAQLACEVSLAVEGETLDLVPAAQFDLFWPSPQDTVLLGIRESFDQQALEQVQSHLSQESGAAQPPRLVVDLSQVSRLTVVCLRALLELQRIWQDRPLALANLAPQVRRVLELAKAGDTFACYPSVQVAQAALEARDILRLPGQMVSQRYRIEARVGENDLGAVFDATDIRLERPVALQVISPSLSELHIQRLLQEAQKLARLQSRHIVTLLDCGQDRGLIYLVTERAEGRTLRRLIELRAQFAPLDVAVGMLRALEYAHGQGVAHGRLTPESVLVGDGIRLKDFGLAWLEQIQPSSSPSSLMGDLHYVSPEQIMGQAIDARADLYAVGVILYELFTGRRPFEGGGQELIDQHLHQPPAPPRQINAGLSRSLEYLILKLLSKQPGERYATAAQVRQVLLGLETATEAMVSGGSRQRKWTLVGRDVQLHTLLAFWERARAGQGQFVLIAGEAGVGKTRLVEETLARAKGALMLVGHCSELEGSPPYLPFVEVIRGYMANTPLDELKEQAGELAGVLANLVPELHHLLPDLSSPALMRPEQERSRLMIAMTRLIERACAARPWLIVLEDLHWADEASLQLLHHLFRNLAPAPLMIIATFRDVELEPEHPLREMLRSSSRFTEVQLISLERLSQDAVRGLLAQIWPPAAPEAWVEAIHARTGGNPFYIQQVARGLTEDGTAVWQDGQWQFAAIGQIELPPSVRDIVLRRAARASAATQSMLRRAAVLGPLFYFSDLLIASEQTEDELLKSLDEALLRHLIREIDAGAELGFSHAEIQQVIYEDMSQVRRQVLHRRIALALEQQTQPAQMPFKAEALAHHFIQAGDRDKGLEYSLKAAERAVSVYAYQTALTWYNQALTLLPQATKANDPALRIQMYRGLGQTLRMLERYPDAIRAYQDMLAAAEACGDLIAQARAINGLAYVLDSQADFRTELNIIDRAEQIARSVTDPLRQQQARAELAYALFRKGWALYRLGDWEQSLALAEQAVALGTELNDLDELAESLNLMAVVLDSQGRYDQAVECGRRALALFQEMGNLWQVVTMYNNLGENVRLRGDYKAALALYQQALSIARQLGSRHFEALLYNNMGATWLALGDYEQAETYLRRSVDMADSSSHFILSESWRFLAEACIERGKLEDALQSARQAMLLAQETEVKEDMAGAWRALGLVAARLEASGQPLDLERLAQVRLPVQVDGLSLEAGFCFAASRQIYTELGYESERARLLRTWALYENEHGRWESAQKMWEEAMEIFERLKMDSEVKPMAQGLPGESR